MIYLPWTEERVADLKRLWLAEGLSASIVAKKLGGTTRSAVCGKAWRAGLHRSPLVTIANNIRGQAARPDRGGREPKPPRVPREKSTPGIIRPPTYFEDDPMSSTGVQLIELTDRMCKWPIGEPGAAGFHFCGKGSSISGPYCPGHACRAFLPVSSEKSLVHSVRRYA